ncbi:peptidoglycan-binding protein [uncultured Nostoc sp.]|uniref:peptidoglycan-binding domain-containing protein n=1 Tax=uncultured Nostoc sp. TaxID=340711 RepID=UPI0035CC6649
MKILKLGESGSEVEQLQNQLKQLGFDIGIVDGQYGLMATKANQTSGTSTGIGMRCQISGRTQLKLFKFCGTRQTQN